MRCDDVQFQLSDALDGGPPPPEAARGHAESCPACSAFARNAGRLDHLLTTAHPAAIYPPATRPARPARPARRRTFALTAALAAAAAVALAAASLWNLPRPHPARPGPLATTAGSPGHAAIAPHPPGQLPRPTPDRTPDRTPDGMPDPAPPAGTVGDAGSLAARLARRAGETAAAPYRREWAGLSADARSAARSLLSLVPTPPTAAGRGDRVALEVMAPEGREHPAENPAKSQFAV